MTADQRRPTAPFRPVPGLSRLPQAPDHRRTAQYDLAWIDSRSGPTRDCRFLPDTPEIEVAVQGFARGAMLRNPHGPVAVEDLVPGDHIMVRGGLAARIDWIGSRSYPATVARPLFFRVGARAFGASGPDTDILLGASAHILIDSPRCRDLVGGDLAFAPIAAFEDGHRVSAISPPGDVTVYGIACRGQEAILASGLCVESYHPARATGRSLTRTTLADMARLFPQTAGGGGFGKPRIPYLTLAEAAGLAEAGP